MSSPQVCCFFPGSLPVWKKGELWSYIKIVSSQQQNIRLFWFLLLMCIVLTRPLPRNAGILKDMNFQVHAEIVFCFSFCDVSLFYRIPVHVYGTTSRQGGATRPTSTHLRTYTYKIKLMCTSERKCTYKRSMLKYTYKRTAAHASSLPYFHHLEKTEPE